MKAIFLVLFSVLLISCNEEAAKEALSTKALNSYWIEKDVSPGAALRLDLRTLNLGSDQIITFYDQDNTTVLCNCSGKMYGTDGQGFYNLNCTLCAAPFDTISITGGSYKITNSLLTLCDDPNDSATCTVYE